MELKDRDILSGAYGQLLQSRDDMLNGFNAGRETGAMHEVWVDSLILGVMHHLHRMVKDQDGAEVGGDFARYANNYVADLITRLSAIDQQRGDDDANSVRHRGVRSD